MTGEIGLAGIWICRIILRAKRGELGCARRGGGRRIHSVEVRKEWTQEEDSM